MPTTRLGCGLFLKISRILDRFFKWIFRNAGIAAQWICWNQANAIDPHRRRCFLISLHLFTPIIAYPLHLKTYISDIEILCRTCYSSEK